MQLVAIRKFLQEKQSDLTGNVFLYYVGHGLFPTNDYFFAIRGTHEYFVNTSSLAARDLALCLKTGARDLRRFLILDCCFAASMTKEFLSTPGDVAAKKLSKDLPPDGTALLCAASSEDYALALEGAEYTMFAEAFLEAVTKGDERGNEQLCLHEIQIICMGILERKYPDKYVIPQTHSPNQVEGDIALARLFPNPAKKIRVERHITAMEVAAARGEAERRARKQAEEGAVVHPSVTDQAKTAPSQFSVEASKQVIRSDQKEEEARAIAAWWIEVEQEAAAKRAAEAKAADDAKQQVATAKPATVLPVQAKVGNELKANKTISKSESKLKKSAPGGEGWVRRLLDTF